MAARGDFQLPSFCDAVVMLTMSDWHNDPTGTHQHFANRFAQLVPLVFVQPDVYNGDGWYAEETGTPNLTLLHVNSEYTDRQTDVLGAALAHMGITRPILWAYNPHLWRCMAHLPSVLRVYHSTEDYLNSEGIDDFIENLLRLLPLAELVPSTSTAQVRHLMELDLGHFVPLVLPNGCDYGFWALREEEIRALAKQPPVKRVIYQGNTNRRLDFPLLDALADLLPDFEFLFCGRVDSPAEFRALRENRVNVRWAGELPLDKLRQKCLDGAAALIPFLQTEELLSSTPLKSFEYLALGLPVMCSNFEELRPYGDMFAICSTPEEYALAIGERWQSRWNEEAVRARMACAKTTDYDARFAQLLNCLAGFAPARIPVAAQPRPAGPAASVPQLDAAAFRALRRREMARRRRTQLVCKLLPEGTRRWRLAKKMYWGIFGHGWGEKA